jgi:NADPH-dependent 2,4-dienoyl-CoA reductase/sulfur reductase-like enzyme
MPSAAALKKVVTIPVVGVGRINSPLEAAQYINHGKADLVALGRQLIADAHWPQKVQLGRSADIRKCIACNVCLDILLANRKPLTCAINPAVGLKAEAGFVPAETIKNVAVVGAGPAGLEAARVAAKRGHKVVVYEATERIGGQLCLACKVPGKNELQSIIDFYENQLRVLGVELKFGCLADAALLRESGAQAVVLATGGRKKLLDAAWVKAADVCSNWDVLEGLQDIGPKVVVIGGGRAGLETTTFLLDKGHEVVIVEAGPRIGADLGLTVRPVLMNKLIRTSVNVFNKAQVTNVSDRTVTIEREGDSITLNDVDKLVLAGGGDPGVTFSKDLEGFGLEVYCIGDCRQMGGIKDAVADGYGVGYNL